MQVLQANLSHINELAKIFDAYRVFYKQESDYDKAKAFLTQRLSKEDSIIFIVLEEGEILGFTQLFPSFSSISAQRTLILNDLFVYQNKRQKGVAKALLQKAQHYAKEKQAKGLTLQTTKDNKSARKLYEGFGYHKDEEFITYFLNV